MGDDFPWQFEPPDRAAAGAAHRFFFLNLATDDALEQHRCSTTEGHCDSDTASWTATATSSALAIISLSFAFGDRKSVV